MSSGSTSSTRYDRVAVLLHWLIALGLIALTIAELIRHEWPKGTFMRDGLKALHNPVGTALFVLILLRVGWWIFVAQTIHGPASALEALLARITKLGLYTLMLVLPLSGIVYVFARGRVIDFGWFQIGGPAAAVQGKAVYSMIKEFHETLAWALIALVALHIAAALWHHIIRKDGVLQRMSLKG